jgi:hypothetical protein
MSSLHQKFINYINKGQKSQTVEDNRPSGKNTMCEEKP